MPQTTALEQTCALHTPCELLNQAFRFAKDYYNLEQTC